MKYFLSYISIFILALCVSGCAWKMLDRSALYHPIGAIGGNGRMFTLAHKRPRLDRGQLDHATPEQLLAFYSPVYVQQYAETSPHGYAYPHDSDLFGRPYLAHDEHGSLKTQIDTSKPTIYAMYQQRKIGSQPHIQLTYTLWYLRHPRTKRFDIEPGDVDSNVIRITLDSRNRPLIYETVLACGCYHKVFVERRLEAASLAYYGSKEHGKTYSVEKSILFGFDFEVAGLVDTDYDHPAPPVIFVSSGEHKVLGVHSSAALQWPNAPDNIHGYDLADYQELQAVPVAGTNETRSMFNPSDDQQVWGADRMERFIFMWIGTDDAGHPRRNDKILLHFDQSTWMDPHLYDKYLRLPPGF